MWVWECWEIIGDNSITTHNFLAGELSDFSICFKVYLDQKKQSDGQETLRLCRGEQVLSASHILSWEPKSTFLNFQNGNIKFPY